MKNIRFTEQQHFRQPWIWLILFAFSGLVLYFTYKILSVDEPVGNNLPELVILILSLFVMICVIALFLFARLDTIIDNEGVHYRYFPFIWSMKTRKWEEISEAKIRTYNPIREYGGWGFRLGLFSHGRAYNVSGNIGLQLVFKGGKKLLVGTNKPTEMENTLKQLGKS